MGKEESLENWLSDHTARIFISILGVALFAALVAVASYIWNFHGEPISPSPSVWGQFGDFFGGILNPVFGFLSVIALLGALVIQSRELRLSTDELKNSSKALQAQNRAIADQRFEQTFFAWMGTYRALIQSIEIVANSETGAERKGRRTLYTWWERRLSGGWFWSRFRSRLDEGVRKESWARVAGGKGEEIIKGAPEEYRIAMAAEAIREWNSLYIEWEYQLDSVFRNLYHLLLWIDSQDSRQLSTAQKWFYVSIVRGQLSWIELVYLFFNGQTDRGNKFKRLVEKYALFDNLTFESDAVLDVVREHPPVGSGYSTTAFNSGVARIAMGLPESVEETLVLAAAEEVAGAE